MNLLRSPLLVCLLSCLTLAVAQGRPSASAPGDREALLWRVSDGDRQLLLLGSIHVLRQSDLPLPQPVLEAYAQADTLVMELDLGGTPAGELERQLQAFGAASPLRTLDLALGERYPKVREQLLDAGIDPKAVNGFDPWFLATVLINMHLQQLGFRGELGVEAQLSKRAVREGRPTAGLETISEQLSVFEGLPAQVQGTMLSEALSELGQLQEVTERTIRAWREADTQALREELLDSLSEQPALYSALVAQRNERWLAPLLAMLQSPPVELVVVGSLHLLGEDSVVQLLAERGLTLEPLW